MIRLIIFILFFTAWHAQAVAADPDPPANRPPQRLPFRSTRNRALGQPPSGRTLEAVEKQPGVPTEKPTATPLPQESKANATSKPVGGMRALATVGASLAMVVGAFLLLVLALRRGNPKHQRTLPNEVLEVLGRKTLNHRTTLQLLRLGSKLVLVAVTQDGTETVCEVDDATEVDRLAGLCRQKQDGSITRSFADILGGHDLTPEDRTARRRRG